MRTKMNRLKIPAGIALGLGLVLAGMWCPKHAAVAAAPTGQYTLTDATVTDTKTGLTWERRPPGMRQQWKEALARCAALAPAGTWRLPTIKELQTLVDENATAMPWIDQMAFPMTNVGTDPTQYWSSTPGLNPLWDDAWVVDFDQNGTIAPRVTFDMGAAGRPLSRCVR